MYKTIEEGGLGIRIIQIPVDVQENPLSSIYFVNHLRLSTTTNQKIEVTNSTDHPLNVAIYPGSATYLNGRFSAAQGATPNELTKWITITPEVQVIPANSSIQAAVRIRVPKDAEPGELFGVVWASTSSGVDEVGFVNVNRVGIRMYIQVEKDLSTSTNAIEKSKNSENLSNEILICAIVLAASAAFLFIVLKMIRSKTAKKGAKLSGNSDFVRFLSN